MNKLICKLLGHDWHYVGELMNRCKRCHLVATDAAVFGKADKYGN